MGTAKFHYFPTSGTGATVETVDLLEGLSDLQPRWMRDRTDVLTLSRRNFATDNGGGQEFRVVLERFQTLAAAGQKLKRELEALWVHLQAGGYTALVEDSDNNWCAGVERPPSRGATRVVLRTTNALSSYITGSPSTSDILVLESPPPYSRVEELRISAVNGRILTLTDAVRFDHTEGCTARNKGCYPSLYCPEGLLGQAAITHDHRITATLDLRLWLDPSALSLVNGFNASDLLGSTADIGWSFDQAVKQSYERQVSIGQRGPGQIGLVDVPSKSVLLGN